MMLRVSGLYQYFHPRGPRFSCRANRLWQHWRQSIPSFRPGRVGEDLIAFSDTSNYAANIEMAEALMPTIAS